MMPIVLAFGGAIASGKSAIASGVAEALGWPRTSFGDFVREEARRRGLDASRREILQATGEELIARGWETFCQAVLDRAVWKPGESLVVDGIRHAKALDTLHRLVAPSILRFVYLEVPAAVRQARLEQRGSEDVETLRQLEAHSTEAEVTTLLPTMADFRVSTQAAEDVVVRQIVDWLQRTDS